jgi:hypothetical protein
MAARHVEAKIAAHSGPSVRGEHEQSTSRRGRQDRLQRPARRYWHECSSERTGPRAPRLSLSSTAGTDVWQHGRL